MKLLPITASLMLLAAPAFAQSAVDSGVAEVTSILSMMRGQIYTDNQKIVELQKEVADLHKQLADAGKPQ